MSAMKRKIPPKNQQSAQMTMDGDGAAVTGDSFLDSTLALRAVPRFFPAIFAATMAKATGSFNARIRTPMRFPCEREALIPSAERILFTIYQA
jgi:hypothetical protein